VTAAPPGDPSLRPAPRRPAPPSTEPPEAKASPEIRRRRKRAVLVAAVVLVGGLELFLGPADERARHGASIERFTIHSRAVGHDVDTQVVVPAGAGSGARRPLLVFLHGRGDDDLSRPSDEFFDALHEQGSGRRSSPS